MVESLSQNCKIMTQTLTVLNTIPGVVSKCTADINRHITSCHNQCFRDHYMFWDSSALPINSSVANWTFFEVFSFLLSTQYNTILLLAFRECSQSLCSSSLHRIYYLLYYYMKELTGQVVVKLYILILRI